MAARRGAVGELAGPGRAGSAIGLLNTAVALGAALTAPVLGAVVERAAWSIGFALVAGAVVLLRGLTDAERRGELHEPVVAVV